MSSPATPVDGIDSPPASIQDENMSPTNDPLIPKHLEMSAKKWNATPFTIKASSTTLTNVKAKMPSFISELEEVNEQLGKSSIHKSSRNAIMTAVATTKLQAFTKDSAKVSAKDVQMIHDCNTKLVSTIISTPDSLLDAQTELLMRSTVPGCSWQSVTRLVHTNPNGSMEKINVLTQYDWLDKWALLSSASLMWVAHDAKILAQDGLSVEFSHLVFSQLLLSSIPSLGIKAHSSPKKSGKSKNITFQLAKKLEANLTALESLKADTKKLESRTNGLTAHIKQASGIDN